jgi:8-oxo-dGTP pyrophosphatase MutT (NUDIX family)
LATISSFVDIERLRHSLMRQHSCGLTANNRASVVLVLRPTDEDLDLLIIRRAVRVGDPWSGHMGLPGGHRDIGDSSDLDTALRETREEVGVDLHEAAFLGTLDDIQASASGHSIDLVISSFVYLVGASPSLILGSEVTETYWVPLSSLADADAAITHEVELNGCKKILPGWNVQGRVVWGLTYRIVSNLLHHVDCAMREGS